MNSSSNVFDALKSRYPILSEPPADAGRLDNDGRRYLTRLWVFGNRELDDDQGQQHSLLAESFSKIMFDLNTIDTQMIRERIISALSALSVRGQHVLVQFWSPVTVGKRCLLATFDQPFALGVVDDEGIYSYRLDSEQHTFVVDEKHREELSPPARVYSQELPEWSFDILTKRARKSVQDFDASYNIHGYILLPVFEPDSGCCVGVLEFITSESYVDYGFEVREVSRALKEVNLKCPNVFEDPTFYVSNERRRQYELDDICIALKTVCDTHKLPLAQTWSLSGNSSFVANSGKLEQSCSSFKKSCIGKICMSTAKLPFYVRDMSMWEFREACIERHLEKSRGVVGISLLTCGSWFCKDVTELGEDDYPLVPFARISKLTSCLAIYIKTIELAAEYVVELFLPTRSTNKADLQSLVKTVKQQNAFQLSIMSSIQEIAAVPFNWNIESRPSLITCDSCAVGTSHGDVLYPEKVITHRKRRRSESSISLEEIKKHFGKPIDEAAAILHVSRSTLKRICRNLGIREWLSREAAKVDVLEDSLLLRSPAVVSKLKQIRKRLDRPNLPYGNGPDERSGTTNISTHGKHCTADDNWTIEATYRENTKSFLFRLSDGLEKLEEVVATRFRLRLGSFNLKYEDKDGDIIWIACDIDLMELAGDFRQSDNTVIKLLVLPVVNQSPDA